jgi:hypothetical protein
MRLRLELPFKRGELDGLRPGDRSRGPVARDGLERGAEGAHRQPEQHRPPHARRVVSAQSRRGVNRSDPESAYEPGGQDHVNDLRTRRGIQHGEDRLGRDHLVSPQRVSLGAVHPRVGRDDEHGGGESRDRDRNPREPVRARREAVPSVKIDPGEDRFDEEGNRLEREGKSDDRPERPHEPRPEEPEFKREDGSRDGADGEQHRERLRPPPGQGPPFGVARLEKPALGDEEQDREAHPETREDDVKPQRERHLQAGREERFHRKPS